MAELKPHSGPQQYLFVLRKHVLDPLVAAETVVEREQAEVGRERDAFRDFARRVTEIQPESPQSSLPRTGPMNSKTRDTGIAELRHAYEETVMAVPHYADVYGEEVGENAVAEFGPEVASLLTPDSGASYTKSQQQALIAASEQRVSARADLCETLGSERESLESKHAALTAVLDSLDTSIVPGWYAAQFEDQLLEILHTRQSTLESCSPVAYVDWHDFFEYLYDGRPWTYPVLTAVARLLDSVTVRD